MGASEPCTRFLSFLISIVLRTSFDVQGANALNGTLPTELGLLSKLTDFWLRKFL
jgi:hypothetical protein